MNKVVSDKKVILGVIILAISVILRGILSILRDQMVIQYGIQVFRGISAAAAFLIGFSLSFTVCSAIFLAWKGIQEKEREGREQEETRKGAVLSVSADMDATKLHDILILCAERQHSSGNRNLFLQCAGQMEAMDGYQEKLSRLLENNGATELEDTQDVLKKAEQYICKEIRKVINLVNVSDEGSEADMQRICEALKLCHGSCGQVLGQVKDFLLAVTHYLNSQGNEDAAPELLDAYKKCILDSVGLS